MFNIFGGGDGGVGGMFGGGGGGAFVPRRFEEHFHVYPVSFCEKAHLEQGDKIVLPPSALDTLVRLDIDYPMLFKLSVTSEGGSRSTHCGVSEFSAPEGTCYIPYWMMQNLCAGEGAMIRVENVTLPKASFVKFRPQSTDFLEISNPKAVLEMCFRTFSCVTKGDSLCFRYNDRNYHMDVREVKPADAACIIEADCEVDFEPPPGYVDPSVAFKKKKAEEEAAATALAAAAVAAANGASGGGGAATAGVALGSTSGANTPPPPPGTNGGKFKRPPVVPVFSGVGMRLDGKGAGGGVEESKSSGQTTGGGGGAAATAGSLTTPSPFLKPTGGGIVLGGGSLGGGGVGGGSTVGGGRAGATSRGKTLNKFAKKRAEKKAASSGGFQAFGGEGNKLR